MRRGLAWAVLSAAVAAVMAFTPGAATAAPARGGEAPVDLPGGLRISGMEVVAAKQSGSITKLILKPNKPGKSARAAQQVICNVFGTGPATTNGGTGVRFDIGVTCDAVVDLLVIETGMAMNRPDTGYTSVPGSYNRCELLATDNLSCTSTSACYPAQYYVGLGYLQGYVNGGFGDAYVQTGPRALPCAV